MAQNYTLQLLRNSAIVADFSAAKAKLQSFASTERKDGEILVCRYYEDDEVKTALGVYYVNGTTIKCSIYRDVTSLNYEGQGTNGKPIVGVVQEDGLIRVSAGNIWADSVDLKETALIEAATVQGALEEIAGKVGKNQVTNTDGSITVTTGTTTDIKVNVKSGDKILSVADSKGGVQTTLTVVKKTSGLAANVKESYEVQGIGGEKLGDAIDIYKDSSLLSVKLLHAKGDTKPTYDKTSGWTDITGGTEADLALCFAYENVNGVIVVEVIPVGDFLRESEFKNGLQVTNGEVSVKIKQNDKYLEVSADGVASKGIDDAIDTAIEEALGGEGSKPVDEQIEEAIEALDSEKTSTDGTNVQVKVTQTDGKISAVSVTTDNTASKTQLDAEAGYRKAVTGVNADTYAPKTDANYIQAATSLKDADEKLDAAIKAVSDKVGSTSVKDSIDTALEDLTVAVKGGSGKFIQSIKQDNGKITATEADLTATNVSATAVGEGSATNVQGILTELHTEIEGVKSSAISVKAGNGISVTGASTEKTIAVKVKDNDPILEVTADGLGVKPGAIIDCGVY